ncbi:MAG: serine/threonine-protein kinase [Vicinamibacterales bacterium]
MADRFEVIRPIGRGGMGEVYEAFDRVLGERVALKVMRSTARDHAAMTARFRREVQLARRVTHPGVCRVHDVVFHRGESGQPLLVLTMELLEGETLGERLRRAPLSTPETLSITSEIAAALDAAHEHGILHGDIKPENVILAARSGGAPRAVLTDFGLARALGGDHSLVEATVMGTPAYMAPELFRGAAPSVATDLYAFALLTYRVLSPADDLWQTTRALSFGQHEPPTLPRGLAHLDAFGSA